MLALPGNGCEEGDLGGTKALGKAGLVAGVIVVDQLALPLQKGPTVFARAALGQIVDHGLEIIVPGAGIHPQVGAMRAGLVLSVLEHLYRGLVGVQDVALHQLGLQGIDQRLQLLAALAHPVTERGDGQRHTLPGVDALQAVQGQVIAELGHQHMGQQPGGDDALVDDVRRHLLLGDALALAEQPAAPQVVLDREDAWHVCKFLSGVLADAFEPAAARVVQVPELLYRRGGGCSELPLHYRDRSLRSRPLPGKTQLQRLELLGIELKVRLLVRSPDKALPVGKSSTPDGAAHYRTPQ